MSVQICIVEICLSDFCSPTDPAVSILGLCAWLVEDGFTMGAEEFAKRFKNKVVRSCAFTAKAACASVDQISEPIAALADGPLLEEALCCHS